MELTTNESITLIFAFIAIIVSIASYTITKQALKNGLREKVYNEQIIHIKELIKLIVDFSSYIDYSQPDFFNNKHLDLDKRRKIEVLIDIYEKFYLLYWESEIFLPKKIKFHLHNLMFIMSNIIENLCVSNKKMVYERTRLKFFVEYGILIRLIGKKLHIKQSIKNNSEVYMKRFNGKNKF